MLYGGIYPAYRVTPRLFVRIAMTNQPPPVFFFFYATETSGGAFLHSGVVISMQSVTFVENRAGEAGLAIMSLGIIEDMYDTRFESNTYYCPSGRYGYDKMEVMVRCPVVVPPRWVHVCERTDCFHHSLYLVLGGISQEMRLIGGPYYHTVRRPLL